jgi:hypothetical protein
MKHTKVATSTGEYVTSGWVSASAVRFPIPTTFETIATGTFAYLFTHFPTIIETTANVPIVTQRESFLDEKKF